MTTGYTPLFSSLTTGTLCGRWPDVGLWAIVLSLANRYGVVDVTPDYLSRITGLPIADVTACMRRFCEPDPFSRSNAEGGARLVLIDPDRSWGWRIVNHGKYREKARKAHYDSERTESGRDAERKRAEREKARDVPTRPAMSPDVPLSDQSNSDQSNSGDSRPLAGTGNDVPHADQAGAPRPLMRTDTAPFHQEVIAAYHEILPDLPRVRAWTPKRARALSKRISERCKDGKEADTIAYWRKFFEKVGGSDFLCGRLNEWRANLEWLITAENFMKIIEGNYANRGNGGTHAR